MSRVQTFKIYSFLKNKDIMDENYLNILFKSCDDISFQEFYMRFTKQDYNESLKSHKIWYKLYSVNNFLKHFCNSNYLNQLNIYKKYDNVIALNKNSQKIWTNQPQNIKIKLKDHQLSTTYAMMYKELNNTIQMNVDTRTMHNSRYTSRNVKHTSNINIGILSDNVGSGKTLSVLSLISILPISIPYFDTKSENIIKLCQRNINTNKYKKLIKLLQNVITKDVIRIIYKYVFSYIDYIKYTPMDLICENSYTRIQDISSNNTSSTHKIYMPSNLIIVPHSLFYQWLKDIKENTNLKVYPIRSKRDKIDMDLFMEYDIILCNANKYKIISEQSANYKWSRIIIDEADTINLPNSSNISYDFLWFITTTYDRLEEHKNIGFIKNTFRTLEYNTTYTIYKYLKRALVIETECCTIEDSFTGNIPKPIYIDIKCKTPLWLRVIKDCVSKTILIKLNAGDIDGAIKNLDSTSYSYESENINIFQYLLIRLKRQIETFSKRINNINIQLKQFKFFNLSRMNKLRYGNRAYRCNKSVYETRLKRYTNYKNDKEFKLKILKDNISKYSLCLLCLNKIKEKSCILKCCNLKFCQDCINKYQTNYNKCPSCYSQIQDIKSYVNINLLTSENKSKYDTKLYNLIKIIKSYEDGKFLIFSDYTFKKIINELDKNNISWKKLCGRPDVIRKLITDYTKGNIKVLMLNAKHYGSGLNLQMTTNIVMFHKMDENTNIQIIGRAQRVGRTSQLIIHKLLYEHEF
jgi:hypothetical protein